MSELFSSKKKSFDTPEASEPPPTYNEAIQRHGAAQTAFANETTLSGFPEDMKKPQVVEDTTFGDTLQKNDEKPRCGDHPKASRKLGLKPRLAAKISTDLKPFDNGMLRIICLGKGDDAKLVVTSLDAIRAYKATTGSFLWELNGCSPLLVKPQESPVTFIATTRSSPDGSLICAVILRGSLQQLIVLDASDTRIKATCNLGNRDGTIPYASFDNNMAAITQWSLTSGEPNQIKAWRIGNNKEIFGPFRMMPFDKLEHGRGLAISFAPDNEHIITCEGPLINNLTKNFSVIVRTYRIKDGRRITECTRSSSRSGSSLLLHDRGFSAKFHFPNKDQWLVSFPDYDDQSRACIMDAKAGIVVAKLPAGLSLLQQWQVGALPAESPVEVAFDIETGAWTRIQQNKSLTQKGGTLTLTRFSSLREIGSPETVVLKLEHEDTYNLSPNGLFLIIQRAATNIMEIMTLETSSNNN